MMNTKVCIGSRGSKLALKQTEQVKTLLEEKFPDLQVQIKIIHTTGDVILDKGLSQIGDKGLFTSALEDALFRGEIDLAVHSMKDVPSALPEGLCLAAILKRETPADVLVSPCADSIMSLRPGAVIGTSSLRRAAQLRYLRPDIEIVNIRGNVETRLKKMEEQQLDGILLAAAGLKRLGLESRITAPLPVTDFLPAVGQGSIGVEMRGDSPHLSLIAQLNDDKTAACVRAERAFLSRLEGGCQVPLAALCEAENGRLHLRGRVLSLSGKQLFSGEQFGEFSEAEQMGKNLAESLLCEGASAVLEEIRQRTGGAE